jgi:signal transduction histidine kinase
MTTDPSQVRLHRKLLFSGGVAYGLWWFFVHFSLPGAFNPIGSRLASVALLLGVAAASYRWQWLAQRLDSALTACCCVVTLHYYYLFDHNITDLNWVVGAYITVGAVCALLQTTRSLIVYSVFVAVVSLAFLLRGPGNQYVVFLPGMFTGLILANVGLYSRVKLLARLRESHRDVERELQERKRAEAQLEQANKELEAFSYSVAHDLRTPLRSLHGFSTILRDDYADKLDDDGKRSLERIQAAAERMGHLIDALLALAQVARKPLKREPVDLSALAEAAAKVQQSVAPARTVEFVCQPGLSAEGDPELLRAVLDNLIANAWKFTARTEHPKVVFSCEVKEGVPEYRVEDNGAGFEMSHASELFGPFHRLHSQQDFPGTGIGLATVQRIIERHGGHVRAEGSVGHGATFFFTLASTSPR